MNILLTSVGRRVQVVELFKDNMGADGRLYTADCDETAPGLYMGDGGFIVPRVNDARYLDTLLDICIKHHVSAVIPFIDPELPVLAGAKPAFSAHGIDLIVSSPEAIEIGMDKYKTYLFFESYNIPTAQTRLDGQSYLERPDCCFPLIVKPRCGSAGQGVFRVDSRQELEYALARVEDPVVQDCLKGSEITIDMFCDPKGNLIHAVPRKRIKVRGGEVERAVTVYSRKLLYWAQRIAEALKPYGPVNVQCFMDGDRIRFTEINCRFGGGYPLAYYAGANFPQLIIQMLSGQKLEPQLGNYEADLVMMRYEKAVIRKKEELIHG